MKPSSNAAVTGRRKILLEQCVYLYHPLCPW